MGLTIAAFDSVFGTAGSVFIAVICVLFGITTTAGWFVFYTTILHHVLRNNEALANKLETVLKICYPLPNIIIVLMIVLTGSGPICSVHRGISLDCSCVLQRHRVDCPEWQI